MPSTRHAGTVSLALVVLLAGCATGPVLSQDRPTTASPGVTAEDVSLCQGERTTVTLRAHDVGELRVSPNWPRNAQVALDWGNVTATPSFDSVVKTLPPYYVWNTVQPSATVTLPVSATANATPGEYHATVTVWHDLDHTHENGSTTTVTVTVRNASTCP